MFPNWEGTAILINLIILLRRDFIRILFLKGIWYSTLRSLLPIQLLKTNLRVSSNKEVSFNFSSILTTCFDLYQIHLAVQYTALVCTPTVLGCRDVSIVL